jgi:hypothetical protein
MLSGQQKENRGQVDMQVYNSPGITNARAIWLRQALLASFESGKAYMH